MPEITPDLVKEWLLLNCKKCPICQGGRLACDGIVALPYEAAFNPPKGENPRLQAVPILCLNCGYVILVTAKAIVAQSGGS